MPIWASPTTWAAPRAATINQGSGSYGDFEFHFRDREDFLWLIYADGFEVPRSGADLQIDPWIFRRSLLRAELETGLKELALDFDSARDELREATIVRTKSGIEVAFEADFHNPSGPPVLGVISLA